MKTVGLIGGVSWHSTMEYYRKINEMVAKRLGGHHSAQMVISNVNFEEIISAQKDNNRDKVFEILLNHLKRLERAGVDFFTLGANTLHMFADDLQKETDLPLIHIVDQTAIEAKRLGLKKLALFGTAFTMQEAFFIDRLKTFDIQALVPDEEGIDRIHRSIFNELVFGKVLIPTRSMYLDEVHKMKSLNCDGVILGCTEIPLILSDKDTDLPLLDTTDLHARAMVDALLK